MLYISEEPHLIPIYMIRGTPARDPPCPNVPA